MRIYLTVALTAVACLLLVSACSKAADNPAATEPKEGLEVGNKLLNYDTFAAATIDGESFKLSDYKGKLLFIDFWATWCPPCRTELPYLRVVQEKHVGDDFGIVGISLDAALEPLRDMAKDYGLTYPQICDKKRWQSDYARIFSIRSIPTNFLIDRNGVIIAKNMRGLAAEGEVARALGLDTPVVRYVEALSEYQSGEEPDLEKVQALLDKALEGGPNQPEFHFFAAELAIRAEKLEDAVTHYETGIEHKDELPTFMPALYAYVNLGQIRLQQGNKDEALATIDAAIEAINALEGTEKSTYSPYVAQLNKLKTQWESGAHEHDHAHEH